MHLDICHHDHHYNHGHHGDGGDDGPDDDDNDDHANDDEDGGDADGGSSDVFVNVIVAEHVGVDGYAGVGATGPGDVYGRVASYCGVLV